MVQFKTNDNSIKAKITIEALSSKITTNIHAIANISIKGTSMQFIPTHIQTMWFQFKVKL